MRQPNRLIHETSPYLLQHAYNPVDWHAWNEETWQKAKQENKPLMISIGYSSCHWCHVMEAESFEDQDVAALMNEHFLCIKVDREEHPEIDQLYMQAVQLVSGHGGWPLNCFALPDGRPFWGGTYFKKNNWMYILTQIAKMFRENPEELEEQAIKLTEGIRTDEWLEKQCHHDHIFAADDLHNAYNNSKSRLDTEYGGFSGAPKFPMPSNLLYLLRYYHLTQKEEVMDFLELTLNRMAQGGIYDQLGGGFSRYSTDPYWKVPHFEKMLYDNAQLVSLYSEAHRVKPSRYWKEVVERTLEFIRTHMTSPEGTFYSAMDADSNGVEGDYYTWTARQFRQVLGIDAGLAMDYYHVSDEGNWEKGKNVLFCPEEEDIFAVKHQLSRGDLTKKISAARTNLLKARESRQRPIVDDKIITSWNALMVKAYVDSWLAFRETSSLDAAVRAMNFLLEILRKDDGGLWHTWKEGIARIDGLLDDYAAMIDALVALHQATWNSRWMKEALSLTDYVLDHFSDPAGDLFFYTPDHEKMLVARKFEWIDTVIPSSNAMMARNLFSLGKITANDPYLERSLRMTKRVHHQVIRYLTSFSNWGLLMLDLASPFYTLTVSGPDAVQKMEKLTGHYFPRKVITPNPGPFDQDIHPGSEVRIDTQIFICNGKACLPPVREVKEALALLK